MNGDPGPLATVIQEVDKSLRRDLTPVRLYKPWHDKLLKEDILLCLWLRSIHRAGFLFSNHTFLSHKKTFSPLKLTCYDSLFSSRFSYTHIFTLFLTLLDLSVEKTGAML